MKVMTYRDYVPNNNYDLPLAFRKLTPIAAMSGGLGYPGLKISGTCKHGSSIG